MDLQAKLLNLSAGFQKDAKLAANMNLGVNCSLHLIVKELKFDYDTSV